MKQLSKLILTVVAAFAFTVAANADVVDIGGVQTDGAAPFSFSQTISAGTVDGITFDFTFSPIAPSWSSELEILITAPDNSTLLAGSSSQAGAVDVEFGFPDDSDPQTFVGTSALLDGLSSGGDWTFTFSENFDDAGQDGEFNTGSFINIGTGSTGIPEPASAALLSLVGLGLVARRRR